MCGRQNARATARDNTGLITKEKHPVPVLKIKISDPTANRIPDAGLGGTYNIRVTIMYNFLHSPLYELKLVRYGSNSTLLLSPKYFALPEIGNLLFLL